jgi:hypothetical protein
MIRRPRSCRGSPVCVPFTRPTTSDGACTRSLRTSWRYRYQISTGKLVTLPKPRKQKYGGGCQRTVPSTSSVRLTERLPMDSTYILYDSVARES